MSTVISRNSVGKLGWFQLNDVWYCMVEKCEAMLFQFPKLVNASAANDS